jgi:hypothetical protein
MHPARRGDDPAIVTVDEGDVRDGEAGLVREYGNPGRAAVVAAADPENRRVDPSRGVRIRSGRIQLGLTAVELADLARRLAMLLAAVDAGEIAVY